MSHNFLAIDIAQRIPDFDLRMKSYGHFMAFNSTEEVSLSNEDKASIKTLLISIYQKAPLSFLQTLPNLNHIVIFGTSTKLIDHNYCQEHQIAILNVTDYCDDDTAEWVLWQILSHFRNRPHPLSLVGKKLGIVGIGAVGKKLIERAQAFHMEIFYNSLEAHPEIPLPFRKKEEIFALCDVISFHTPPQYSWLDHNILSHTKPESLFINTCMGKVSLDHDLEDFLKNRSDVTYIMDAIAGQSYPDLQSHEIKQKAFLTNDSQNRLIDKFFLAISTTL